jgi:hypothetical protein
MNDLAPEFKQAALAACGLVVSLFLPWYEKSAFFPAASGPPQLGTESLSAFEVISFVEAAVVLVAAGVLFLAYQRAQKHPFHLPGGDGTVIMAAGGWAALLLIWRLFDKPDVSGAAATVGIQWGWFVALVLAGLLALSGARLRAAHRPEPPNPAADPWEQPVRRRERRRDRPVVETEMTEVPRERPLWEGEPPDPPPTRRHPAPEAEDEPEPDPPRRSTSQDRLF